MYGLRLFFTSQWQEQPRSLQFVICFCTSQRSETSNLCCLCITGQLFPVFPVMPCVLVWWWVQSMCVCSRDSREGACVDMLIIPSVTALSCPPVCLPVCLCPLRCPSACLSAFRLLRLSVCHSLPSASLSHWYKMWYSSHDHKKNFHMCERMTVLTCVCWTHTHTHTPSQLSPVPWSVLRGWDVVGWGRWNGETRAHLLADPPSHCSL